MGRRAIEKSIREINRQMAHILAEDTGERVMSFTDSEDVKELLRNIDAVLEDRQKQRAEHIRAEFASRRMLSDISHDMKTPLTVILGYLEILQMEEGSSPVLGKVREKAEQVLELMNQFFTLAKLESGDLPLEMERVELNEVCRRNLLDFYQLLKERGTEVEISLPEAPVYVHGNRGALDRILFNLISNAVRYGGDGKYLGLFLKREESLARVQVSDHGKGIPGSALLHVFDRLYTLEESRSREMQGNGLGLTIVKSLAEKMQGEVSVQSIPGESTVFEVVFPVMKY